MGKSFFDVYRFFLGYNFMVGVRTGVGIFAPLIILLLYKVEYNNVLAFCFGALIISTTDKIGPIKHKINEMFSAWILISLTVFIAASINQYPILIGLFIILITFIGSLIGTFGIKGTAIGFSLIFATIISIKQVQSPLIYSLYTSAGCLCYALYTLILAYLFQKKSSHQALADAYFLLGRYLRALSFCYRQYNTLDESYQSLMAAQADLLESQQIIRDLIYRQNFKEDQDYLRMTQQLLVLIDIQEKLVTPFQDFRTFRKHFANSDIQIFFRDLTLKAAVNLEGIGLHSLGGVKRLQRLGFKAELRALEYEIELKKREHLDKQDPDIYHLLMGHYKKYLILTRQLENLRELHLDDNIIKAEDIQGQFYKFIKHQPWTLTQLKNQFNKHSSIMRHSIRTSLAMAFCLLIVAYTSFLNHGFWIAFTIVTLMNPGFSVMRQKTRERIIGTIIGCIIGGVMINFHLSIHVMIAILFVCIVLSNGLGAVRLDLSIIFSTIYVLVLSNYQYPASDFFLALERILDTLIGASIAIVFSFLLPSWERFELESLKMSAKQEIRNLVASIESVWVKKEIDMVEYRLNRRATLLAIAAVTNCFNKMQREPKAQQANLEELSYFISRNQSVASELIQLAYLLDQYQKLSVSKNIDIDYNTNYNVNYLTEFYLLFDKIKAKVDTQLLDPQHWGHSSCQNNPLLAPLSASEIKPLIWLLEEQINHLSST
ncbi:transporter [Gammaproteobacteria bacterium]|nr:transporter [Gammaproteobacteria bacterium]